MEKTLYLEFLVNKRVKIFYFQDHHVSTASCRLGKLQSYDAVFVCLEGNTLIPVDKIVRVELAE